MRKVVGGVSWQIVVSVVIVGLTWPGVQICAKEMAAPLHRGTAFIENDWKSSVELAKDGSYRLSWKPTEERIVFLVEVRTNGYVGLGFSLDGRMVKADIAVGWVHDKTKRAYLLVSEYILESYLRNMYKVQTNWTANNKTFSVLSFQAYSKER